MLTATSGQHEDDIQSVTRHAIWIDYSLSQQSIIPLGLVLVDKWCRGINPNMLASGTAGL